MLSRSYRFVVVILTALIWFDILIHLDQREKLFITVLLWAGLLVFMWLDTVMMLGIRSLQSFRRLLERADFAETLDHDCPSEDAFLDAGCRVVELSDIIVAVWDGLEARGKGGTGDIVHYARKRGREILVIWPSGIAR